MSMDAAAAAGAGSAAITVGVRSACEPIVDLSSRCVVAYEARARGAMGGPFERPDVLFAPAHERGLTAELATVAA